MVYVDVSGVGIDGAEAVRMLAERGVKVLATGPSTLRFVTYRGIRREDIASTVAALRDLGESVRRRRSGPSATEAVPSHSHRA
jgi:hypothetical protein